mgnify:CR=1 FL=1
MQDGVFLVYKGGFSGFLYLLSKKLYKGGLLIIKVIFGDYSHLTELYKGGFLSFFPILQECIKVVFKKLSTFKKVYKGGL